MRDQVSGMLEKREGMSRQVFSSERSWLVVRVLGATTTALLTAMSPTLRPSRLHGGGITWVGMTLGEFAFVYTISYYLVRWAAEHRGLPFAWLAEMVGYLSVAAIPLGARFLLR